MAKKHFLIPEDHARKFPAVRTAVWWLEAQIVKALVWLIRSMSPERAGRLANFLFRKLKALFPFTKKIRNNLTVAFPEKSTAEIELLTRNACGYLGNVVVELVLAERIWAEREQRLEFVTEPGVDIDAYRGRPVVMITGHIGAWQIGLFLGPYYGLNITSVFAPEENPYLRDFLSGLRAGLRTNFISRDGCMRGLANALKQGGLVGMAADTRMDGGDLMPFFGISAPTNTTAARLAIRYNCDLLPAHVERLPGMKYRIHVYRPVRPDNPDAPRDEQARQMTQRLLEHFEAWIRETPDQWLCYGRRWPLEVYSAGSAAGERAPRS